LKALCNFGLRISDCGFEKTEQSSSSNPQSEIRNPQSNGCPAPASQQLGAKWVEVTKAVCGSGRRAEFIIGASVD
jgi:hypothetical protein